MKQVVLLSLATASISFTVTETKLFLPFRDWLKEKNISLGRLMSCGYCFGHWVAFILVAIYRPRVFHVWWLLDYLLTALIIAWLAALAGQPIAGAWKFLVSDHDALDVGKLNRWSLTLRHS